MWFSLKKDKNRGRTKKIIGETSRRECRQFWAWNKRRSFLLFPHLKKIASVLSSPQKKENFGAQFFGYFERKIPSKTTSQSVNSKIRRNFFFERLRFSRGRTTSSFPYIKSAPRKEKRQNLEWRLQNSSSGRIQRHTKGAPLIIPRKTHNEQWQEKNHPKHEEEEEE